jgi:hypothetical protein
VNLGCLWGLICKIVGVLVNWICNLGRVEGLRCKIEWLRVVPELEF